jgi:hypothetical protein
MRDLAGIDRWAVNSLGQVPAAIDPSWLVP